MTVERGRIGRLGRAAVLAFGLFAAVRCSDHPSSAPEIRVAKRASLALAPRFATLPAGAPTIELSKIRGVLLDAVGDSVVSEAAFVGDSAVLVFTVQLTGSSGTFQVDLTAYDKAGQVAFHGVDTVTVKPGDNPPVVPPPLAYAGPDASVAKIQVVPNPVQMNVGTTAGLAVTGTNAAGQPVTAPIRVAWSSRNPDVATVDPLGVVTAGAVDGSVYIVAQSVSGAIDSTRVNVHAAIASFVVTPNPATVAVGAVQQLAPVLKDAAGHTLTGHTVRWSSNDESKVTVSSTGLLTGKALGSTIIVAIADNGAEVDVPVTVVSPVDHIEATPNPMSFASLGEQQMLAVRVVPFGTADASAIPVAIAIADPTVVSIDANRVVTALRNGSTSITIKADVATLTVPVTVRQVVHSVTVSPKSVTAASEGDHVQFTASVLDARNQPLQGVTVVWTSSNDAVASVSSSGLATTGATNGSATITATTGGLSDAAAITLARVPVVLSIQVPQTAMTVGQTMNVTASLVDANGHPFSTAITFSSSNPSVLGVTSSGAVTALAQGSAAIQASGGGMASAVTITVSSPNGNPTGVYGYYADLGSNSGHAPNYLLGTALSITQSTTVSALGVLGRAAGPNVKLALYTDLNGAPNRLIVATPATPLIAGRLEIPVSPTPVPAGTYWIMGIYDVQASIGISFSTNTQVDYVSWSFGSAMPAVFPSPIIYSGQLFNYWVRGNP